MRRLFIGIIFLCVSSALFLAVEANAQGIVSVDIKANGSNGPITIVSGESALLKWTVAPVFGDPVYCTASNGWSGAKNYDGSEQTGSLTSSKTYTLTCNMIYRGIITSDSVTVNVVDRPSVDLKVNGSDGPITVASGTIVNLTWTSNGSQCSASSEPASSSWSFVGGSSGGPNPQTITSTRTYKIYCLGGGGFGAWDTVTVNVSGGTANQPPVAAARISANNGSFGQQATVTRGVPAFIKLSAGLSFDPDGWTTALLGVSQGGKCEWNSDLNTGTTTYERTISSPASPSSCDTDLGYLTFNDPPGWYLYPVLRITDASTGVSNVASVTVIVAGPNDPTPTPDPSGSPSPTPSCNPFGYNSNCPTPTPTPSGSPTPTPTVTPPVCPVGIDCTQPCPPGIDCTQPCPPGIDCTEPCPPGTTCSIVEGIIDDVIDTFDDIVQTIANAIGAFLGIDPEKIAEFIKKASNFLTNAALALGIPLIIANLLPQLAQWGRFFGSFFGAHHRKDRWGIVVDSDVGKPVAGAVVQVFDAAFNKLKETQVTGKDGQFGFLLVPGKYYVVVSGSGFTFPARKKAPVVLREHERIYLGEEFTISDANPETIPHIVVPLDREERVSNTRAILARFFTSLLGFVDRVGFAFLFVGAGINTYLLLLSPNTLNIVFEVLYLLLFMLKLYILVFNQKGIGMVTDGATKAKLDLAIVRLYDAATNRIVQTRVTNKNGRFFLLVPRGTYTVAVSKQGYETLTMGDVQIKRSGSKALSLDFSLKQQI